MSLALRIVGKTPIFHLRIGSLLAIGLLALYLCELFWRRAAKTRPRSSLADSQQEYSLAPNLEILRDPTGKLTIGEVSSPTTSLRFHPNEQSIPNLGITTDAVWLRFRVHSQASPTIAWLLVLQELRHNRVDLYIPKEDGAFSDKQTGRDLPFSTRYVPHRFFVFYLPVPPGAQQTFYMRFASVSPMVLPLSVWSTEALAQDDQTEILFYGLFYGAMLIMAGYNLFLFGALRDKSYLFLSLFILTYSLNMATRDGLANEYLFPNISNAHIGELSAVLFSGFLVLFSISFLETRVRVPRLHQVLIIILPLLAIWFLLSLFLSINSLGLVLLQISFIVQGIAGFQVWRQGYRPARLYLMSWLLFFGVAFLSIVNSFGVASASLFSGKLLLVAIALGALLGSLALADRFILLRQEAEHSRSELERSEHRYHSLFDNSRDGIFLATRQGEILEANPAWLNLFRMLRSDLAHINSASLYADPADGEALLQAVDERGYVQDYEARLRRPDGTELIALISLSKWAGDEAGQVSYQGAVRDITEQRRIEQEMAQQGLYLKEAVAEERGRLARELHDSATQSLYSIGAYANAAARALQVHKNDIGAEHIQQIIQLALEAMVDMRALIYELRPPVLEKVGLAAALQTRLQAVEGRAGVEIEFHTHGNDGISPGVQTEMYRTAQEALSNVVKHAHARHVMVNLDYETDYVVLEIRDDGDGIDLPLAQQKDTMGLRSIAERTRKINGELTVEGKPGQGTLVRVEVPYE